MGDTMDEDVLRITDGATLEMTPEESRRYDIKSLEWLEDMATGRNCHLIKALPLGDKPLMTRELLLDIDTEGDEPIRLMDWLLAVQENVLMIQDRFDGLNVKDSWQSKSGKGLHVILNLGTDVSLDLAIALQVALGSDPAREIMCAYERLLHPDMDLRVLFRPRPKLVLS